MKNYQLSVNKFGERKSIILKTSRTIIMEDAKNKILKKLRKALTNKVDQPYPELKEEDFHVYPNTTEDLLTTFSEAFEKTGGILHTADNFEALVSKFDQLRKENNWTEIHCKDAALLHLFKSYQLEGVNLSKELTPQAVGLTKAITLVARTGSLLLNSYQAAGRKLNIAPEIHIVFAERKQIVYNIKEALKQQKDKNQPLASLICLTTGASRTADIEKTLVMGAHGPRALYLFLKTS